MRDGLVEEGGELAEALTRLWGSSHELVSH
jgi:hypothetical protein